MVERRPDRAAAADVDDTVPVTPETLAATGEVPATQVARFAAPCVESECPHVDGETCRLAARMAEGSDVAVDKLPPCAIRKTCCRSAQEGGRGCARCPQAVTRVTDAGDPLFGVALPDEDMDVAWP